MSHAAAVTDELSDTVLVHAARAGRGDAMTALFHRHRPAALGVARRRLSCRADVDDAVAEAFTRTFERLGTLRDPACFRPFLLACVRNAARDRYRGVARLVAGDTLCERPHAAQSVEGAVEAAEDAGRLAAAVGRLAARQRFALHRFYWDDAPVAQIASELGLSTNATTQLLFRARASLARRCGVAPRRSGR